MRIVSLVPSLSELIASLGLKSALVGVTSFCVHPPELARVATIVGGTKDADLALIAGLKPTHILVNREENTPEVIAACRSMAAMCETMPVAPGEVPAMIASIAHFLGSPQLGSELITSIEAALDALSALASHSPTGQSLAGKRYLYYIWAQPWMVASAPTYIDGMLALLGLVNAAPKSRRYPELSQEEAAGAGADLLCFSSEPWPFRRRDEIRLRASWPLAPAGVWADGRLLSWYGSTTLTALNEMQQLLRGESHHLFRPLGAVAPGSVAALLCPA